MPGPPPAAAAAEPAAARLEWQIPTIDLSLADHRSTLPSLLSDLRRAVTEVGFLYLSNHGIPARTVRHLVDVLPQLFALPEGAKRAMALENSPHFLGYSGLGAETTGGRADRREQVEFATELPDTWRPGQPLYERLRGPNQWPPDLPELDPIVESYLTEMTWLGERFLTLVAQSLGLPRATFIPFLSDQHRLKLVHYPPGPPDPASPGVGPHKDSSGWWTFLLQVPPPRPPAEVVPAVGGGLQVLDNRTGGRGCWVDVPAVEGTLVVLAGQAFEVVTNGACRAAAHRVLLSGPLPRYSVPFFQGVRRDLRRDEAAGLLRDHFADFAAGVESDEARGVDSAFIEGRYETYGEAQLRTKVRSHRACGRKFYGEVYDRYIGDDSS